VFSTYKRKPTIAEAHERDLYAYIMGIVKGLDAHLFRIGGMPDHVHIVVSLPSKISLADFVKEVKLSSGNWLLHNSMFPLWEKWEEGYGAFTYSYNDLDEVINYVRNQKEHHKNVSFAEEYRQFLVEAGIDFDEKFMPK
jgi:REP element-mobilizing transposase RayT